MAGWLSTLANAQYTKLVQSHYVLSVMELMVSLISHMAPLTRFLPLSPLLGTSFESPHSLVMKKKLFLVTK